MFENITKNTELKGANLVNLDHDPKMGDIETVARAFCGFNDDSIPEANANAEFIAYCFNLQQKYDISMLEECVKQLNEIDSFFAFNNSPSKEDISGIKQSIKELLTKVKK